MNHWAIYLRSVQCNQRAAKGLPVDASVVADLAPLDERPESRAKRAAVADEWIASLAPKVEETPVVEVLDV
jgi:hypothetical protein